MLNYLHFSVPACRFIGPRGGGEGGAHHGIGLPRGRGFPKGLDSTVGYLVELLQNGRGGSAIAGRHRRRIDGLIEIPSVMLTANGMHSSVISFLFD